MAASLASAVIATGPSAARAGLGRSLDRPIDPVAVDGAHLPEVLGRPVASLRVEVWRDGAFAPIPFQIDERNAAGGWVYPSGPEANADEDAGRFDANDVLFVMARDLAGARPAGAPPPAADGAAPAVLRELTFRDPLDGRTAYAYLTAWDDAAPPPSPVDYVRYVPETDDVRAANFSAGFSARVPFAIDRMSLKLADGTWAPSHVDILKIRLRSTIWSVYDFDRDQDDFESVTAAWIDGPVRVVLHKGMSVSMILGIQTPKLWNDTIFLPYSFQYSVDIALPFSITAIFSKFDLMSGVDFDGLSGAKLYVKGVPEPVAVAGEPPRAALAALRASGAEQRVTALEWNGVFSLTRIHIDRSVPLEVKVRWVDDPAVEDPPERKRGATPGLYFDFENWLGMEQKNVTIGTGIYLPPGFQHGDEETFERRLDHPVELVAPAPAR
ncbi:MAG: hypothetical protein IPK07_12525 [Deltaproteobacteria bacterium]|nr:hypothetical protein [Deltaproteobacteria bacterium]